MKVVFFLALWFTQPAPEQVCFASDVKAYCCPAACTVKKGPKWYQADEVLRGCMKGLGCSVGDTKGATVGMRCQCSKGGAQ